MKRNRKKCKSNKKKLIKEYGRFCMLCGRRLTVNDTTYHHIVPLSEEGTNDIENGSILGEECCHIPLHENDYNSWCYQNAIIRIRWYKDNCKRQGRG